MLSLSPAASIVLFPDPVLSASVYCSGRLSEVIERVVAPFWRQYRQRCGERADFVWVMRYARCGEHLKVRLHAGDSAVPLLRELLATAQAGYFSRLPAPADGPRTSTPEAPPIDGEDQASTDYPDRTLRWTEYRRHHLSLGYRPYLDDDGYVALLARCLGCSTQLLLGRLKSGADGQFPYPARKSLWVDSVLAGLPAALPGRDDRLRYLLYHRDILLRHLRKRRHWRQAAPALARLVRWFDAQAELPVSNLPAVKKNMTERWTTGGPPAGDLAAWSEALRSLSRHVSELGGGPAFQVDPFAERPAFPALFKALHGLANQIGLDAYNEAFLYHLLIAATGEADLRRRPVRLRPEL